MPKQLVLDGLRIQCFSDFVTEFNKAYKDAFGNCAWNVGPDWDGCLLDLDNFLEAPPETISIHWLNSKQAQANLGYEKLVDYLEDGLQELQTFIREGKMLTDTSSILDNRKKI